MSTYHEITADDLFNLMADGPFMLVDVRNEHEIADGIIAGARHVPLPMLPVQYQTFSNAGNIVFYCHSGVRSAHAAAYAVSKGCQNVYTLVGGILAWQQASHTLASITEEKKHAV